LKKRLNAAVKGAGFQCMTVSTSFIALFFVFYSFSVFAQPKITPTIQSASETGYPPFSLVGPGGEADGFSVELLRAALEAMHYKVHFNVGAWRQIKQDLATGKIQVLPLVGRTPEREAIYDFSITYLTMHGAIFTRKNDDRIHDVSDLKDKEVLVMEGDNAFEYVSRAKITSKIITVSNFKEAMTLLSEGKHDAVVVQELLGLQLIKELGVTNLKTVGPRLDGFVQNFCFAVTEGDKQLLSILNEGLSIVITDGTLQQLKQKWFGPLRPKESSKKTVIIVGAAVLGTGLLMFLVAWVWQRSLRRQVREKTLEIQSVNNMHQAFFNIAGDSIFVIDQETRRFLEVNESAVRRLGYSKEEFAGLSVEDINGEMDPAQVRTRMMSQLHTGSGAFETVHKAKSGQLIPVEIVTSTVEVNGRKALLSSARDITERKQSISELRQAKIEAETANIAKSTFLANMSHEIRTPLNAVLGYSQLLEEELVDPQNREFLDGIYKGGEVLLSLITDILEFSKIESGKVTLEPKELDLNEFLGALKSLFAADIKEKQISFDVTLLEAPYPIVLLDHNALRQVVTNLVANAIKFTDQGGVRLETGIRAIPGDDQTVSLKFEVIDTGMGIPEDQKEIIFEAFEQQKGQHPKYGGTGLGLSISRRLALALDGYIQVEDNQSQGSTFSLNLDHVPVSKVSLDDIKEGPSKASEFQFGAATVLIVDDVVSNRKLLSGLIAKHNLTPLEAENGQDALDLCKTNKPDLILLDYRMPGMDGLQVAELLKNSATFSDIPIIMLSATVTDQEVKRFKETCDSYLPKPLNLGLVMLEIKKYLG